MTTQLTSFDDTTSELSAKVSEIRTSDLIEAFRRVSRSKSSTCINAGSEWDLTEESKDMALIVAQAFKVKPGEALGLAAAMAVTMIEAKIDPENAEENGRQSRDQFLAKFQASELHSNTRCHKNLDLWMTEPERPSIETVCLSVFQKIPANCSTIDLAHVTHRINVTYGI
jgi:hypothetical protein